MALTDILPSLESDSRDSFYERVSEEAFGEACSQENCVYPNLTPVYNGRALDIPSQFVHATLSGISIKHYRGKCSDDSVQLEDDLEEEEFYEERGEMEEFDWFPEKPDKSLTELSQSNGSNIDRQPLCTLPKMNYRNSFWNLHRPELCKLTWGQKYVSTATVTEHLHGHLLEHGPLCQGFHTDEERQSLLDKELDEYVKLKVLANPRGIPPDEPLFYAQTLGPPKEYKKVNPKCKSKPPPEVQIAFDPQVWFIPLSDDDDGVQNIHRLKEEFCLTIGKHKRLSPIFESTSTASETELVPEMYHSKGEEEESFFYNWDVNAAEESFGVTDDSTPVRTITYSDTDSLTSPCPPLMLDEFCKAAGKVDFSDLRCPDL